MGATAEFDAVARACGHLQARRRPTVPITSRLRVPDIQDLRTFLCHADDTARQARLSAFHELSNRRRMWQGVHDRGEAHIFAGAPLEQSDQHLMREHFPARLKALSIANLKLKAGHVLDLSTHPDEWDVGHREELYLLVNIDRCSIGRGAKLVVRGNVASILIQSLALDDDPNGGPHIEILGTSFPVDSGKTGPLDGEDGARGYPGGHGAEGTTSSFRHTMFGSIAIQAAPLKDCAAGDGREGLPGGGGRKGRTGGMCKTAEITVRRVLQGSGMLHVHAEAGRGGNGGHGGPGGRGGDPGTPGLGFTKGDVDPRLGATALPGNGGDGGNGGHGGNGGISSNVFITCPAAAAGRVQTSSRESQGGRAGKGGRGGMPGTRDPSSSANEIDAKPGKDGLDGIDGRSRPRARIYVNEQLTT